MNTLGLDIGTSGCKAAVFDAAGNLVAAAHRDYPLIFSAHGGAELDAETVMASSLAVIAESAGRAGGVEAVGVSSQGEAFTAVDRAGKALTRAMVSSDARSLPHLAPFLESFGAARLYRLTGHTAHPMFTLFKLLWLRENQRKIWRQAAKFLCFEDLLSARLGVEPAMGWPLAGRTMLFDVRRHQWSPAILDAIGLEASRLARPLPAGSVSGIIPPELGRKLNLAPGCVLITGGHDQTCASLGAGVTAPGVAMYATGSVECICPAFARATFNRSLRDANLCTYDFTLPGLATTVAFSLTGGNLLQWFRDQFGAEEVRLAKESRAAVYDLLLQKMSAVPTRLQVLPYFTPSGTPYFDAATPGAILGLRLSTTRGEILRALLEGVALEMRLNLEILQAVGCAIHELRAVGGGAKSPVWNQLKADVLGRELAAVNVSEAGCRGAALLARTARTGESAARLAGRWTKVIARYRPNPRHAAFYREKFARYRALYPRLRQVQL